MASCRDEGVRVVEHEGDETVHTALFLMPSHYIDFFLVVDSGEGWQGYRQDGAGLEDKGGSR